MSVVAVLFFAVASILVLVWVELIKIMPDSTAVEIAVWVFAFYLSLNTLANITSKSKSERVVMTPISLCIAICLFVIAFTT
jgi:hypothetical protein